LVQTLLICFSVQTLQFLIQLFGFIALFGNKLVIKRKDI